MAFNICVGALVMLLIVLLWFLGDFWQNTVIASPDGQSRITGSCGDTMEISIKCKHDKIVQATHWTNGCSYSLSCVYAASQLARGKTPLEVFDIKADKIQRSIGGLPSAHRHCATLAEQTLHAAVDDYMRPKSSACRVDRILQM